MFQGALYALDSRQVWFQAAEQYHREVDGLVNGSASGAVRRSDLDDGHMKGVQEFVNFSPVYRCYHIFTVLGAGEKFQEYYRSSRAEQAKVAMRPANKSLTTMEGYRQYFDEVVGFFVVEEHIAHTAGGLLTQNDLETAWAEGVGKVLEKLRENTGVFTDAPTILRIKKLITLFAYTVKVS